MTPNALPRPGDVVAGKYRIDSVIGQGGMGVVLGAMDTSLNRPVAIKFLSPARAMDEATAARFAREARAAASIQNEHVVRVHEVGATPSGAPFIVMEHLRGGDLASVLEQRGALPFDYACDLVLQACEALGEAHARGIVHRDLKPQNLFLTQRPDGTPWVKVLDFGISKAAADEQAPQLTSTDMVMGTPLYMSPEQVRSVKNVDARADIWALGAILHELLTGGPPFDGPTASALHAAIAMDPPPPLRTKRPDAPAALEAIILHCLEKNPASRFQNVGELADALRSYASPIGQLSAARVVRTLPSSQPVVVASLAPPPLANASTMQAWQSPTAMSPGAHARVPKKSSPLALILGIVVGVLLLGSAALAALFVVFYRGSVSEQSQSPSVGSGAQPYVAVSVSVNVPPIALPTLSSVPVTPVPQATSPRPPVVLHDAGPTQQQILDARQQQHCEGIQTTCSSDLLQLRTKSGDAKTAFAQQSKGLCRAFIDACQCERDVCRESCTALNDQNCLLQLNAADNTHKARF